MLRIVHDVPKWHVYLHREARELPPVQKDDTPTRKLEDEVFDRLYAGGSENPLCQRSCRIEVEEQVTQGGDQQEIR